MHHSPAPAAVSSYRAPPGGLQVWGPEAAREKPLWAAPPQSLPASNWVVMWHLPGVGFPGSSPPSPLCSRGGRQDWWPGRAWPCGFELGYRPSLPVLPTTAASHQWGWGLPRQLAALPSWPHMFRGEPTSLGIFAGRPCPQPAARPSLTADS